MYPDGNPRLNIAEDRPVEKWLYASIIYFDGTDYNDISVLAEGNLGFKWKHRILFETSNKHPRERATPRLGLDSLLVRLFSPLYDCY
jgi:hypothetical protein